MGIFLWTVHLLHLLSISITFFSLRQSIHSSTAPGNYQHRCNNKSKMIRWPFESPLVVEGFFLTEKSDNSTHDLLQSIVEMGVTCISGRKYFSITNLHWTSWEFPIAVAKNKFSPSKLFLFVLLVPIEIVLRLSQKKFMRI